MLLIGQPSISMGHQYHGELLNYQRVVISLVSPQLNQHFRCYCRACFPTFWGMHSSLFFTDPATTGTVAGDVDTTPATLRAERQWLLDVEWFTRETKGFINPPGNQHTVDGCEILHQLIGDKHPTIYRLSTIQAGVGFRNHPL